MPQTAGYSNATGCSIKVGTTGTIGSLMTRELESLKNIQQGSASPRAKSQSKASVSVPCGTSPRKLQPKRSSSNEVGSSSNNNNYKVPLDPHKSRQTPSKNGRISIISADKNPTERMKNRDKRDKKGHSFIAEVVDLKCNNPMSSRLRKLGFSKLSESIM